jgi:DNA-binding winged helix-turn-helix (wHTH) protein/tetratricopeptide (TPR) repeat protein
MGGGATAERGGEEAYRFGTFVLDARRAELRRDDEPIKIFPRAFDLLLYLVRNRDRIVPRDELLDALWPGVTVTTAVLTQTIWELRKGLGDGAGEAGLIRNVRGRGYRFVAEVELTEGVSTLPPMRSLVAPVSDPLASYVGREPELARLRSVLDAALNGRGAVHLIGGEPGIGKTRMAEELLVLARARGARVLEGRCYEAEGGPPFWPWLQIVRALVADTPVSRVREWMAASAPDLCRFCADLRLRFPEVRDPPERSPDEDRFYLLDGVANFLVRASQSQPLVLLLDDLHWADRPSLHLLEMLARMVQRSRMLALGTYRSTEQGQGALAEHMPTLLRNGESTQLSGLSEQEVARWIAGEPSLDHAAIAAQLHHVSSGNPLFVVHIARLLRADPASYAALAAGQLLIPEEVRDVIGRRIAQLPEASVALLGCAAALGQRFRGSDLRRVADLPQERMLGLLQDAVDARIVSPEGLGSYRFGHPLIREALHQGLRMPERARLHQRIADVLEATGGGEDGSRLDELAYHACEAAPIGGAERAVHYAERAAARALASTAYEAAAEYYRRALQALELSAAPSFETAVELRLLLGQALRGARENPEVVKRTFLEVAEMARSRHDAALLARAALGYSGLDPLRIRHYRDAGTVDPTEVALLEEALSTLPEADSDLRALLLGQLANALYNTRERKRREHLASAGVEMARRLGDPKTLAEALLLKHRVFTAPDQLDERLELLSEILSITQVMDLKALELDAFVQRAFMRLQRGELAAAEGDIAAAVRLAEELNQPDEKEWARSFEILRMFWEGRFEEGERESQLLMEKRAHRGMAGVNQGHAIRVMVTRWLQGRGEEVVGPLLGFAEKYPLPVVWRCALASSLVSIGKFDDARRELERLAVQGFEDLPYDHNWLSCHMYLATVCRALRDRERAMLVYRALEPYAERIILLGHASMYAGPVAGPLGRAAEALGRTDDAVRHYERSLEVNTSVGARAWKSVTQLDLALLLWRRNQGRDRQRATALFQESLATARELSIGEVLGRAAHVESEFTGAVRLA